jgi:hypothetical protein
MAVAAGTLSEIKIELVGNYINMILTILCLFG